MLYKRNENGAINIELAMAIDKDAIQIQLGLMTDITCIYLVQ